MADSTFLYVFRGGADPNRSPDEMQRNMQKWATWIEVFAKEGRMRGGDPLEFGGKVVAGDVERVAVEAYCRLVSLARAVADLGSESWS